MSVARGADKSCSRACPLPPPPCMSLSHPQWGWVSSPGSWGWCPGLDPAPSASSTGTHRSPHPLLEGVLHHGAVVNDAEEAGEAAAHGGVHGSHAWCRSGPRQTPPHPFWASPGEALPLTGPLWEGACWSFGRPILGSSMCSNAPAPSMAGATCLFLRPREGEDAGVRHSPALGVRHLCGLPRRASVCRPTLMVWTAQVFLLSR